MLAFRVKIVVSYLENNKLLIIYMILRLNIAKAYQKQVNYVIFSYLVGYDKSDILIKNEIN